MERIDLVIFDCDGVLIDSEGLSGAVLIEALAEIGVAIDFDDFCTRMVGRSFPTVAADLRAQGAAMPDTFEATYRARLLARFERDLAVTDGVRAMLDALDRPACVATSSSPTRVRRSLDLTGLAHLFGDNVFTASQVSRGKPAPDLFLLAAERMGAAPVRCLVVEDSLPGLEAATAAGMRALRYTGGAHLRGRQLKHAPGTRTFDDWAEFSALLGAKA